jgi:DNA-binding PadR family transcriptional regulator
MEEQGWISALWGESENNRKAKYYQLTKAGKRQLESEARQWEKISAAIGWALQSG